MPDKKTIAAKELIMLIWSVPISPNCVGEEFSTMTSLFSVLTHRRCNSDYLASLACATEFDI
jgi:hypothetical protein